MNLSPKDDRKEHEVEQANLDHDDLQLITQEANEQGWALPVNVPVVVPQTPQNPQNINHSNSFAVQPPLQIPQNLLPAPPSLPLQILLNLAPHSMPMGMAHDQFSPLNHLNLAMCSRTAVPNQFVNMLIAGAPPLTPMAATMGTSSVPGVPPMLGVQQYYIAHSVPTAPLTTQQVMHMNQVNNYNPMGLNLRIPTPSPMMSNGQITPFSFHNAPLPIFPAMNVSYGACAPSMNTIPLRCTRSQPVCPVNTTVPSYDVTRHLQSPTTPNFSCSEERRTPPVDIQNCGHDAARFDTQSAGIYSDSNDGYKAHRGRVLQRPHQSQSVCMDAEESWNDHGNGWRSSGDCDYIQNRNDFMKRPRAHAWHRGDRDKGRRQHYGRKPYNDRGAAAVIRSKSRGSRAQHISRGRWNVSGQSRSAGSQGQNVEHPGHPANKGIFFQQYGPHSTNQMMILCEEQFETDCKDDSRLAFGYWKESKAMQINGKQISDVMTVSDRKNGGTECRVMVLNIDLHFKNGGEIMYLVAGINDAKWIKKMEWMIRGLCTAQQLLSRFGICALPRSSREPLMKWLEYAPNLSQREWSDMIRRTKFHKLNGKRTKRLKCQASRNGGDSKCHKGCREFVTKEKEEHSIASSVYLVAAWMRHHDPLTAETASKVMSCSVIMGLVGVYLHFDTRSCGNCGHSAVEHGVRFPEEVLPNLTMNRKEIKKIAGRRSQWANSRRFVPVVVNQHQKTLIEWKTFIEWEQNFERHSVAISIAYSINEGRWNVQCLDYDAGRIYYQHRLISDFVENEDFRWKYEELMQRVTTTLKIS